MKKIILPCAVLTVGLGSAFAQTAGPSGATFSPPATSASSASSGASPSMATLTPPASWEGSEPLTIARPNAMCTSSRLGIWARLVCKPSGFVMDGQLLGGSHEGVRFKDLKAEGAVEIVFPMREGDRREMYIATSMGRGGYTVEEDAALSVSETWLPGEKEATIVIAGNP